MQLEEVEEDDQLKETAFFVVIAIQRSIDRKVVRIVLALRVFSSKKRRKNALIDTLVRKRSSIVVVVAADASSTGNAFPSESAIDCNTNHTIRWPVIN